MTSKPRTFYYRARDDLLINNLPFFFGRVEIHNGRIKGEHYKPKFDKSTKTYTIGYYNIEGDAVHFLETFRSHGDVEITTEEFEAFLMRWTQENNSPPVCWGLGTVWEVTRRD